jgi:hypothetical protein
VDETHIRVFMIPWTVELRQDPIDLFEVGVCGVCACRMGEAAFRC